MKTPSHASASSLDESVRLGVPLYKHHLNHDFDDDAYFDAYSRLDVHDASIMDRAMIEAFWEAIFTHNALIKNKIVLDIGCGFEVLSFLCVAAGSKRVYTVDANEHIATKVKEIVEGHNLTNQISVIHGKIEDVEEIQPVDVIISNWMGCLLFDENMLESIIFARDRWLKIGGLILPSHAEMYLGPVTCAGKWNSLYKLAKWNSLCDINTSAVNSLAKKQVFGEPITERVDASSIFCSPHKIISVDLYHLQRAAVGINKEFSFQPLGDFVFHAFAFWFKVYFNKLEGPAEGDDMIILSTGPADPPTHWAQTLLYAYSPLIKKNTKLEGTIQMSQSIESPRFLDITVTYNVGEDVLERHGTFRC